MTVEELLTEVVRSVGYEDAIVTGWAAVVEVIHPTSGDLSAITIADETTLKAPWRLRGLLEHGSHVPDEIDTLDEDDDDLD